MHRCSHVVENKENLPLIICVIASSNIPDIPNGSNTVTNCRVRRNGTISGIANDSDATPKA